MKKCVDMGDVQVINSIIFKRAFKTEKLVKRHELKHKVEAQQAVSLLNKVMLLKYVYLEVFYEKSQKNCDIKFCFTVLILNSWTDRFGQRMMTKIRMLLEEQSNLGFHCLPFHLYYLEVLHHDGV